MEEFNRIAFKARDTAAAPLFNWQPDAELSVTVRRPTELIPQDRQRWADLSVRATPGNVFAADWFMEPALRHCGTAWSLRLAVVRQRSGEWLGVLPLNLQASIGGCPVPNWRNWQASSAFMGTPLVRAGAEKAFWQAFLAHFDRHPGLALGLSCGNLPSDSPALLALSSLCAEQDRTLHCLGTYTRPARWSAREPDSSVAVPAFGQQLDRLEARLAAALGPVNLVLHSSGEDCEPWLAAFLALERAGSKDRTGRTRQCQTTSTAMFRDVIRHSYHSGTARLASLRTGDQIVAMACWFIEADYGYGFRLTSDEAWARLAPGSLLMRRIARLVAADPALQFDTCAPPGAHSDPFWPDQRAFGSFAIGIGAAPRRAVFDAALRARSRRQQF